MRRTNADQIIRGGQTTQHWVRMGAQVVRSTMSFGALVFAVTYGSLCLTYYKYDNMHVTWAHFIARFTVENRGRPDMLIRYRHPTEGFIEQRAEDIYLNPAFVQISQEYEAQALAFAWYALAPAVVAAILAFAFFLYSGRRLEGDSHIRGTHLVTHKELKRWSEHKWRSYRKMFGRDFKAGPEYTIAGIKFPPNAVEAQTSICGTVGTGKSNAIKELLTTVRDLEGRAIIYDRMGVYVRDFYDPETDIIINPFDSRSRAWSPFFEATRPEFFTQLAEVLIPDKPNTPDPFWSQAARIVFDYAAQTIFASGQMSNAELRRAILEIPSEELSQLIEQTPGRHFFNQHIARTADSIRANLISELRFLEFLRDDAPPFSIRKWVKEESKGFVFLTGDAEHSAATRNIISSIFEVAANALMTCEEANEPRIWFMMDEVPTLNRMPFLSRSLAEIRQFGGAFVVGYQVFSQLEEIYGDKGAKTISGNLNNRIIFNTPDADTAEIFSKSLGSEDVEERRESISVGAHETRDGVGFMSQRTERRIVTASQIQSLPQFEGYIRFAYDAPTAFVRFKPFATPRRAEKFIEYHGGGFSKGAMESLGVDGDASVPRFSEAPQNTAEDNVDERALFERYRARLVASGLEIYADSREQNQALWTHFVLRRRAGEAVSDIGPPAPRYALMGARAPQPIQTAAITETPDQAPPPVEPPRPPETENNAAKPGAESTLPSALPAVTDDIFDQLEAIVSGSKVPR